MDAKQRVALAAAAGIFFVFAAWMLDGSSSPEPSQAAEGPVAAPAKPPPRAVSLPPKTLPDAVALGNTYTAVADEADVLLVSCRLGSGIPNHAPMVLEHGQVQDGWFFVMPWDLQGETEIEKGDPEDESGAYRVDISWDVAPGQKRATCRVGATKTRAKVSIDLRNEAGVPVAFDAYGCGGFGDLEDDVTLNVWSEDELCSITVKPTPPYAEFEVPFEIIEGGDHIHIEAVAHLEEAPTIEEAIEEKEEEIIASDAFAQALPWVGDVHRQRVHAAIEKILATHPSKQLEGMRGASQLTIDMTRRPDDYHEKELERLESELQELERMAAEASGELD